MSNSTNSTIPSSDAGGTGSSGNSTIPSGDAGYWHQNLELAVVCICTILALALIVVRTWIRRRNAKRFLPGDIWIMVAGALMLPYWACQIGLNRYGSGLHSDFIPPEWGPIFFGFQSGWAAYYFIASMIKVSECLLLLGIIPPSHRKIRWAIYGLCFCIMGLGIGIGGAWLFQCLPIESNFNLYVVPTFCIHFGPPRYTWVALGIVFDLAITVVPVTLLAKMMLKSYERQVLMIMFSSNLLGTIFLAVGAYGIWITSNSAYTDYSWTETIYISLQNLEVLSYTLGASAPVFTRFFVSKTTTRSYNSESRWNIRHASNGYAISDGSAGLSHNGRRPRSLAPFNPPAKQDAESFRLGYV